MFLFHLTSILFYEIDEIIYRLLKNFSLQLYFTITILLKKNYAFNVIFRSDIFFSIWQWHHFFPFAFQPLPSWPTNLCICTFDSRGTFHSATGVSSCHALIGARLRRCLYLKILNICNITSIIINHFTSYKYIIMGSSLNLDKTSTLNHHSITGLSFITPGSMSQLDYEIYQCVWVSSDVNLKLMLLIISFSILQWFHINLTPKIQITFVIHMTYVFAEINIEYT